MSLHAQSIAPVPPQTRQVAQAAFPKGNRYMQLRDTLGTLYDDTLFADLFPQRGQPAQAPWQLALVTLGITKKRDQIRHDLALASSSSSVARQTKPDRELSASR